MMNPHALPSDTMADGDRTHRGQIVEHVPKRWTLIKVVPLAGGVTALGL
jgi:hypothetical protein